MPRKALPGPIPSHSYNWSGCYIGGQVGWAWHKDKATEYHVSDGALSATTPLVAARSDGFIGGGHLGCNWQWGGPWVVGIEGDVEHADLEALSYYVTTPPDSYRSQIGSQASLRGRLGYAIDRNLFYVTGGAAWAKVKHSYYDSLDLSAYDTFSHTRTGWTVGGGWEYAFDNNWTARLEYRYADFGDVSNVPTVAWTGLREVHEITEHAVRVGLSYKFGPRYY